MARFPVNQQVCAHFQLLILRRELVSEVEFKIHETWR